MKIVLLTNGSSHGLAIARALRKQGVMLTAVVLEVPGWRSLLRRGIRVARQRGLRALISAARARARRPRDAGDAWDDLAGSVVAVPALGGDASIEALRHLEPDLVILGGAPILAGAVLEIARLGTLNAHPGLLPAYRGVDVVAWAVLNGDPVGATVHLVDAGVDTGPICRTQVVPLRAGESLEDLRARVELAAAELIATVVVDALARGAVGSRSQSGISRRYRLMDAATRQRVRDRLDAIP